MTLTKGERHLIDQQLDTFITSIDHLWSDEPLDDDETGYISSQLQSKLDKLNGNTGD